MGDPGRPTGWRIGHLLRVVAVAAALLALLRSPESLMRLAAFGPLGILGIVAWLLIVWVMVRTSMGRPKG